jgi:membrane associated rhomboid family serine protease
MLFLWIFGDNIENAIGHIRYGVFYLMCGFAAAVGQIILGPDSIVPMLGASGRSPAYSAGTFCFIRGDRCGR